MELSLINGQLWLEDNAEFKENVTLSQIQSNFKDKKPFIDKNVWAYHNGLYVELQAKNLFLILKKALIKKLHLFNNQRPIIIKDIQDVQFPKLNQMSLSLNDITSLEALQNLYMPMLSKFHLCLNQITNVSSMRKMQCPHLQTITIDSNFINEFQPWTQFHLPQLKEIIIQSKRQDNTQGQSYFFYFKLQTQELSTFDLRKKKRMRSQLVNILQKDRHPLLNEYRQQSSSSQQQVEAIEPVVIGIDDFAIFLLPHQHQMNNQHQNEQNLSDYSNQSESSSPSSSKKSYEREQSNQQSEQSKQKQFDNNDMKQEKKQWQF